MSIKALSWAFDTEVNSASQKLVLLALSNFSSETGKCYPSVSTVCQLTHMDDKTVRNALRQLEDLKIIEDTGKRTGATQQVKIYQLPSEAWTLKIPKNGYLSEDWRKTGGRLEEDTQKRVAEPVTGIGIERPVEVEPPISRKEFDAMVDIRGYDKECADWFWNNCEGVGWIDQYGRRILKVESLLSNALRSWKGREYKKPNGSLPLWRQIEGLQDEIEKHVANSESIYHRNNCTDLEKADLRAKRIKLRELKATK